MEDTRHILKILSIFAFIIPFWSIFEQTASSWVSQGSRMIPLSIPLPGGSWSIGPAQIQAANPIFVMVFIPLITVFVYPRVATLARPLVRLGTGLAPQLRYIPDCRFPAIPAGGRNLHVHRMAADSLLRTHHL